MNFQEIFGDHWVYDRVAALSVIQATWPVRGSNVHRREKFWVVRVGGGTFDTGRREWRKFRPRRFY
jgi:hypothetical protein